jgi:hypothetical protein
MVRKIIEFVYRRELSTASMMLTRMNRYFDAHISKALKWIRKGNFPKRDFYGA